MLSRRELSHSIIESLYIKIKWEMQRARRVGFAIFRIADGIACKEDGCMRIQIKLILKLRTERLKL